MKKIAGWLSLVIASMITITGCGSDSKSDAGNVVGSKNITLSLEPQPIAAMDTGRGTYIARYAVHAVDGNGNPQSRLPIDVALVNKSMPDGYDGAIHKTEPVTFSATNVNFAAMGVRPGDTLIIIPVTYGYEEASYVGNWKVSQVNENLTLGLDAVYNLVDAGLLHYVVGNERSFDGYLAHVQSPDDTNMSTTVPDLERGLSFFDIVFDKALVESGRCVWVGVHLAGNRTGTARCVMPIIPPEIDDNATTPPTDGNTTCSAGGTCPSGSTSTCTSGTCPTAP